MSSNEIVHAGRTDARIRGRRWHLLVTLLLACSCAVLLHARVYTAFERLRINVVRTAQEASGGSVTLPLPDLSRLAGQPIAVVLRLTATGSASPAVRIAMDGDLLTTVSLVSGREKRVDLSLPAGTQSTAGNLLEITSAGDGWSLTFLEVANVHGFSRGLFEFMIVPDAGAPSNPVGVLPGVALFVLMLRFPGFPAGVVRNRFVRDLYMIVAALVYLFLAMVLVAPLVSDYAVLLASHTFLVLLAVLYYPTIEVGSWKAGPMLRAAVIYLLDALRRAFDALRRAWAVVWARRVPLLYLASFVLFVVGIAGFYEPETGFTFFIRFGTHFDDRAIPALRDVPLHVRPNSGGYDGQFYAQLAVDPLLLDPATVEALDTPSYRARRILFSWTAFLFGFGQPQLIVHAYAIQNAVFWILLALLLIRWFPAQDFRSFCLWFGCLFSHGAIVSVVRALPDGPSLLLLALAVLAVERGRTGRAAALVGVVGLAKDSNLLWSAVLCDPAGVRSYGWRDLCVRGLLVAGPLALWMFYLWSADAASGSLTGSGNFAAPLTGYITKWGETLFGLQEDAASPYLWLNLLALVSLTTQAVVLVVVGAWDSAWWRAGIMACALMVFLGPAVWAGSPGAATRVLLPMTVAFNAVLPRNRWLWPVLVLGNLTIINGLEALNILDWVAVLEALEALRTT